MSLKPVDILARTTRDRNVSCGKAFAGRVRGKNSVL